MAPRYDEPWSANESENEAVASWQFIVGMMTQSLYDVREADYADPSGGYVAGA